MNNPWMDRVAIAILVIMLFVILVLSASNTGIDPGWKPPEGTVGPVGHTTEEYTAIAETSMAARASATSIAATKTAESLPSWWPFGH